MPKLRISNFLLLLCITIFFNASGHSQTPNTAARQAVASKITEPTDSGIEAYYLGQRERRPLEEVKPRLRETLKQARVDRAKQAYIEELRRESEVAVLLAPPQNRDWLRLISCSSNADAPVTIIEFSGSGHLGPNPLTRNLEEVSAYVGWLHWASDRRRE